MPDATLARLIRPTQPFPPEINFKRGYGPFFVRRIYYGERIWSPAARSAGNAKRDRSHPAA
ncbi:mannitol-1-phosphate 5-dehydrogenase [Escherichia coli]|nr:mannitol-1-phosphate 5-dehydrogenase [Escherichia coli]AHM50023.1 mannitol-1-phosphate 5-dehydrogenase [Escherichia coli]AHM54464.1 mannitol-1-phosphate 5-dehydrogenase [Escherichia coli]ONG24400.1 hypothetical protein BWX43_03380 [Escherichia coli]